MKETLQELKVEGHDLLDDFCHKKKIPIAEGYRILSGKLGIDERLAHFSMMNNKQDVIRAIVALQFLMSYKQKPIKKYHRGVLQEKKEKFKPVFLKDANEILKENAERNKKNAEYLNKFPRELRPFASRFIKNVKD